MIGSVSLQWFTYTSVRAYPPSCVHAASEMHLQTRTLVRIEAIITQLVFEHALRMRVKAETTNSATGVFESPSVAASTPDSVSVAGNHTPEEGSTTSGDETPELSSTGVDDHDSGRDESSRADSDSSHSTLTHNSRRSRKSRIPSGHKEEIPDASSPADGSNLVGKINNLVTTDLGNITDARNFLIITLYVPLQIVLCILFLYVVLGWR